MLHGCHHHQRCSQMVSDDLHCWYVSVNLAIPCIQSRNWQHRRWIQADAWQAWFHIVGTASDQKTACWHLSSRRSGRYSLLLQSTQWLPVLALRDLGNLDAREYLQGFSSLTSHCCALYQSLEFQDQVLIPLQHYRFRIFQSRFDRKLANIQSVAKSLL